MNGRKALLDSNIIIFLSKGMISLDGLFDKFDTHSISIVTYMEVLGFPFKTKKEARLVETLLAQFELLHLDLDIANIVIGYRQKGKIKLPDAIILATAKMYNCTLVTANTVDFEPADSTVQLSAPAIII